MKKEAIRRGMSGFPLGVFIGYTITIILSLFWGEGYYWAVVPALVEQCGNEINAVILQFILSGVLGSVCAASSVIWENDNWSILKQTVIHFVIISFTMLPIAYFAHWMDHTFIAIVKYFFDTTVKNEEFLSDELGLTSLGVIYHISTSQKGYHAVKLKQEIFSNQSHRRV